MNFVSSIILRLVAFASYFAAIPYFLAHQGHETYGVVAFLLMILGYSSLFDNGITYTVTLRYVGALSMGSDDPESIVGYAFPIYAILGGAVAFSIFLFAPYISMSIWGSKEFSGITRGMSLVIFLQVAGALFASVLLARNKVMLVNMSRMTADVGRVFGIVLAAHSAEPLVVVVIMMAISSFAKMAIDLWNCSRLVGLPRLRPRWSISAIVSILRSSAWMWCIAGVGLATLVYDKWYVSSAFSSEKYSYYSIANDFSTKVFFVLYAFTGAIYTPLMRRHATNLGPGPIYRLYFVFLFTVALAYYGPLFVFSEPLLTWYVSADLAANAVDPLRVMIGSALVYLLFNTVEIDLYAKGMARYVLPSYVIGIVSLVCLTPYLARHLQITGVAISVFVMQVLMLISLLLVYCRARIQQFVKTWIQGT